MRNSHQQNFQRCRHSISPLPMFEHTSLILGTANEEWPTWTRPYLIALPLEEVCLPSWMWGIFFSMVKGSAARKTSNLNSQPKNFKRKFSKPSLRLIRWSENTSIQSRTCKFEFFLELFQWELPSGQDSAKSPSAFHLSFYTWALTRHSAYLIENTLWSGIWDFRCLSVTNFFSEIKLEEKQSNLLKTVKTTQRKLVLSACMQGRKEKQEATHRPWDWSQKRSESPRSHNLPCSAGVRRR